MREDWSASFLGVSRKKVENVNSQQAPNNHLTKKEKEELALDQMNLEKMLFIAKKETKKREKEAKTGKISDLGAIMSKP